MSVKIDQLKRELDDAIGSLVTVAGAGSMDSVAAALTAARENLRRDDYTVVVCGEVKQGKTSFINALLGQDLLPVAVKVATSQVFRISYAEKESFSLVFDNGEREEITRDEMVRYGTETGENLENDPHIRGRSLRWIEVNVHATFLPPNVHLLDTPGLGALYRQHALITHKYVASADGVIFVKEAKDPIVDQERSFLKKVFEVTRNVLFVQSKCDLYNEDEREALAKRSEEILNKEFGSLVGRQFRFWPVSSQNLFDAAKEQDSEARAFLKEVSGFDSMLQALEELLFRAAGYATASAAYVAAFKGYQAIAASLQEQRKVLGTTDVSEKQRIQKAKIAKQQEFVQKWGPAGTELKALNDRVRLIISAGQARLQGVFAPGGDVRQRFVNEINGLPDSLKEIELYASTMPDELLNAVCVKWREIVNDTQRRLSDEMKKHCVDVLLTESDIQLGDDTERVNLGRSSLFDFARNVAMGGGIGYTLAKTGVEALIYSSLITGPLGGAVALGVIGLATVAGIFGAKKSSDQAFSKQNKAALLNSVANQMGKIHAQLCVEPQESGLTWLQEFCEKQRVAVHDACKLLAEREKGRLDQELKLIVDAASADAEKARQAILALSDRLAMLPPVKEKLTHAYSALAQFEK